MVMDALVGETRDSKPTIIRLDLQDLDVHASLLEDLRLYVGPPERYIPEVFKRCIDVLREVKHVVLTHKHDGKVLDEVYRRFYGSWNEKLFKQQVANRISIRTQDYRDRVTEFYYNIFLIIYPQIAQTINRDIQYNSREERAPMLGYTCTVDEVVYLEYNDGFGECTQEQGVFIKLIPRNEINSNPLIGTGYEL